MQIAMICNYLSKSIVRRLNFTILTITILGMAIYAGFIGYYNYNLIKEDLDNKLNNTIKIASVALENPLWHLNLEGIEKVGESIFLDSDVVGFFVVDADSVGLEESEIDYAYERIRENIAEKTIEELNSNHKYLSKSSKIVADEGLAGSIKLFLTAERATNEIKSTTMYLIFFTSILVLLIGIMVSLIGLKVIKKPISFLKARAIDLTRGDLSVDIKMSRNDELGSLSDCFSNMRDAIKAKIDQINEYNRTLELKVAERTKSLREKNAQIQTILQNIQQGIFTISENDSDKSDPKSLQYKIDSEYSAFLEKILETTDIDGQNMMDLLFRDTDLSSESLSNIKSGLVSIIGEDVLGYELNSDILISEFTMTTPSRKKIIAEIDWCPILDENDIVVKMMVTIRDVTVLRSLEAESNKQKEELTLIIEILAVAVNKFEHFITSTKSFLEINQKELEKMEELDLSTINLLFRNLHTIKGNARALGLATCSNVVHEVEQVLAKMKNDSNSNWNKELLFSGQTKIILLIEKYNSINTDVLERKSTGQNDCKISKMDIKSQLDKIKHLNRNSITDLNHTINELSKFFLDIYGVKFSELVSSIKESANKLATSLNKEAPIFEIKQKKDLYFKDEIVNLIINVFNHLIRNSLDHGIESEDDRIAKGKPKEGHILIEAGLSDSSIVFKIQDDGNGLNLEKIRKVALSKQIIKKDQLLSDAEIGNLIFESGFSTSDVVTDISGRGVGMDAVKNFVENEGGSISIDYLGNKEISSPYRRIQFEIKLPRKYAII